MILHLNGRACDTKVGEKARGSTGKLGSASTSKAQQMVAKVNAIELVPTCEPGQTRRPNPKRQLP